MATREEQIELIQHPGDWPATPFLPMRRPETGELGLMISGMGIVVVEANLVTAFQFWWTNGERVKSAGFKRWLSTLRQHRFGSLDALFDDGWIVD